MANDSWSHAATERGVKIMNDDRLVQKVSECLSSGANKAFLNTVVGEARRTEVDVLV